MGEKRNTYGALVEKPVGKIQLGRASCKWENNVQMEWKGIGWGDLIWIKLVLDRDM
jgi:hypothetical protein